MRTTSPRGINKARSKMKKSVLAVSFTMFCLALLVLSMAHAVPADEAVFSNLDSTLAFNSGGNRLEGMPAGVSPVVGAGSLEFPSGGNYPEGIGIDESNNVWIANSHSNKVAELSNAGKLLGTFAVGTEPHGVKIDRAKTQNIWVENIGGGGPGAPASCPSNTTGTVTALAPDGRVIGTFCTGGNAPQHAQFDALGNVWVTNEGSNTVAELNGTTGRLINTFPTGHGPHAIGRDQRGNFWIGNYHSGTVTVLASDGLLLKTIRLVPPSPLALEPTPTGNAIDSSGGLWQAVQNFNIVQVFAAPPSFALVKSVSVGAEPRGVTIDEAGNVFVANRQSNDVIQVTLSGRLVKFPVGKCPENMAIDSMGDVWVTNSCSSTVSVLSGVAVPSRNSDDDSDG